MKQNENVSGKKIELPYDDLKSCVEVLKQGGVILYPTDTVWGIGCDATNELAVKRIFDIKQREDSKSMLVLVDSEAKLQSLVDEVPEKAWDLIELSEKPLTIIYPKAKNLAKNLIASDQSIGIRVTREAFSKKLCELFRKPIISTSANKSGQETPVNFSQISQEILSQMDYIVRFRQEECSTPKPSGIIKLELGGVFQIIRA